jgi:hypothetical protein
MKTPRWQDVFRSPEERRFFTALSKHSDRAWHSVPALAQWSGLLPRRVTVLLEHYQFHGLVVRNPADISQWGLFETLEKLKIVVR